VLLEYEDVVETDRQVILNTITTITNSGCLTNPAATVGERKRHDFSVFAG
jgi:hypothetical protein